MPDRAIEELLAPLKPNEHALTPFFQANIDDSMLQEIAAADYGSMQEECFALLKPMLESGQRPPWDWHLLEVLQLTQWGEPEDPEHDGYLGAKGHWIRLFACIALIRYHQGDRVPSSSECETLAQLTSSAIVLGPTVAEAAASVLAWRFLTFPSDWHCTPAFLAFAILVLAAYLEHNSNRGPWLNQLATWAKAQESLARKKEGTRKLNSDGKHDWLLSLSFHRQRELVWRALALYILARPKQPHPPEARELLQLLGELVAGI